MIITIWDKQNKLEHVATNWATYLRMMTNFGSRFDSNPESVAAAIGRSIDAMLSNESDVLLTIEKVFDVELDFKL
jgi:hypothetical protein